MDDSQIARELGGVNARLDGHDSTLNELKTQVSTGFTTMGEKIDQLRAAEYRRKGAVGVLKLVVGSGVFTGTIEALRAIFRGHHGG